MTQQLSNLFHEIGVVWVLDLLIVLGIASVAVTIARILFLWQNRVPVAELQPKLLASLSQGQKATEDLLVGYRGMEAQVVLAGVREMHRGPDAVAEIMAGKQAVEKQRYETFLNFLSSVGANSPFIGLLGTVIGILGAFADLKAQVGQTGASRQAMIMGSISEALVATAIGLFVAIPAVVAYNQFRTIVKKTQSNTDALASMLLAHLKTTKTDA
jgi:biopolymer transport protein ExbB